MKYIDNTAKFFTLLAEAFFSSEKVDYFDGNKTDLFKLIKEQNKCSLDLIKFIRETSDLEFSLEKIEKSLHE